MFAKVLTQTGTLTTDEWLSWRRLGIGGSDTAAVMGKDRRKPAMQVYLDKIGETPEKTSTEAMLLGKRLKSFIAQQFTEITGYKTFRRNILFQHPHYEYLIATIDRWVVGDHAGLLCKSAGEYIKQEWENDEVPPETNIQCQHYMAVTGADHWWVAVLIGGNKMHIVRVERDESLICLLLEATTLFWREHVLSRVPPNIDGSTASTSLLGRMYPPDRIAQGSVALPHEASRWIGQYLDASKTEKMAIQQKTEAENRLKMLLGQHESGTTGVHRVEWKRINRKTGNQTSYRRFVIHTLKNKENTKLNGTIIS